MKDQRLRQMHRDRVQTIKAEVAEQHRADQQRFVEAMAQSDWAERELRAGAARRRRG